MRIAIASIGEKIGKWDEDIDLRTFLQRLMKDSEGIVDIIGWRDSSIDFKSYDAIFISSTWNASAHADEFLKWISDCESDGVRRLINDREVIERCFDKKGYIAPLSSKFGTVDCKEGSIIPSLFLDSTDKRDIDAILSESGWTDTDDVVIKPRISAQGYQTRIFSRNTSDKGSSYGRWSDADFFLKKVLSDKSRKGAIIQPLIRSVMHKMPGNRNQRNETYGEFQLVFFNGKYSHATGKPKIFRDSSWEDQRFIVKDDLPIGMLKFAYKLVNEFDSRGKHQPRIRLDFFLGEKGPLLSEVELIEPDCSTYTLYSHAKKIHGEVLYNYSTAIFTRAAELKADRIAAKRFQLVKILMISSFTGAATTLILSLLKKPEIPFIGRVTAGVTVAFFTYLAVSNKLKRDYSSSHSLKKL